MTTNPERVFLFRLARELGMTVGRLMQDADSREIAEWIAFFGFEAEEDKRKDEAKDKLKKAALAQQIAVELKGYDGRKSRKPSH